MIQRYWYERNVLLIIFKLPCVQIISSDWAKRKRVAGDGVEEIAMTKVKDRVTGATHV